MIVLSVLVTSKFPLKVIHVLHVIRITATYAQITTSVQHAPTDSNLLKIKVNA